MQALPIRLGMENVAAGSPKHFREFLIIPHASSILFNASYILLM